MQLRATRNGDELLPLAESPLLSPRRLPAAFAVFAVLTVLAWVKPWCILNLCGEFLPLPFVYAVNVGFLGILVTLLIRQSLRRAPRVRLKALVITVPVFLTLVDTAANLGLPDELIEGLVWSFFLVVTAALVTAVIPVVRLGTAFRAGLVSLPPLFLLVMVYNGVWPTIASTAAFASLAFAFLQPSRQRWVAAGTVLVLSAIAVGSWGVGRHLRFRGLQATVARGERLQRALDAYHDAEGSYPCSLDWLVPKHLSEVPRAKGMWEVFFRYHNPCTLSGEAWLTEEEYYLIAKFTDFCPWIGKRARTSVTLMIAPETLLAEASRHRDPWACEELIDHSGSFRVFGPE